MSNQEQQSDFGRFFISISYVQKLASFYGKYPHQFTVKHLYIILLLLTQSNFKMYYTR